MEDDIHKQLIQDEKNDDNVKKSDSWMDIILSDGEDIDNMNTNNDKYNNNKSNTSTNNNNNNSNNDNNNNNNSNNDNNNNNNSNKDNNNNNNSNNKINSNTMNNNIIKNTINHNDTQRREQSKNNLNINNSQCLSDVISDSQSTFDDEDIPSINPKNNSNNNNSENIQISTFVEKHRHPLRQSLKKQTIVSVQQQQPQQQNKKNVYNQPTFSLVSSNESNTLIELKNLTNGYSFKKDGLASAALGFIKSETSEFQKWQQSVKIAMAKHGSVVKIWKQWKDTRLCRLIDVWNENGMILGWCVDMNKEEEQLLTNSHQQDHDDKGSFDNDNTTPKSMMMMIKDTISEINSQPMIHLPTYESNEDNRQPYLCMFSFVYDLFHSKSSQSKLLNAEYLAIWPPWTAIPITLNNEVYHVHIITRFILDDYF
ncbi:unnamed protein product [Cunninghamella echinulata]